MPAAAVDTTYIPVSAVAANPFSAPFASASTCLVPFLAGVVFLFFASAGRPRIVACLPKRQACPASLRTSREKLRKQRSEI